MKITIEASEGEAITFDFCAKICKEIYSVNNELVVDFVDKGNNSMFTLARLPEFYFKKFRLASKLSMLSDNFNNEV